MRNRKISLMMLSVLMCSSSMVYAQKSVKKDTIRERQIEEISVKGHSLRHKNTTSTVNVITNDEIKNLVVEQPLRVLEQLPGINVIGYGQGGVADQFSMRGFAGGGHEGQAGVEIDGVSLNEAEGHSDGYADLNVLIPINLRKITVYKGPSSALHGRFSQAGTVSLETRKGGNYNDVRLSGGSYSTFDAQYAMGKMMKVGNREDALKVNLAAQVFNTNGYIKNSGILKGNFSGRLAYQLSNSSEIAVSVLGHRSEWDAPGYIPREQYLNRAMRNRPHETAEHDGGRKAFLSERVDFNHKISDNVKLRGEGLELLLQIRNSAERDIYIKEISKKYGISVESIYLEIEKKEKNIKTDGISAEAFLENAKKETEKDLENDKEKAEKIKKYTEELILIKVLIYNKSARVNFKNNISLSVISDELNRKTIDNIIQNIDLDEVKLIDKLLLDEEISKKITEILSRDDNIFKSDMNIEEKDPMIVLKSFENRTLEERMKMIEKSLVLMERTEENKEIILELEKEFKEIISKLYNK